MATNRNRKEVRNPDMKVEFYSSIETAISLDRSGLLDTQNFDSSMNALFGLEALDAGQDFVDGELIEEPVYMVVRKLQDKREVQARKVKTRVLGSGEQAETADQVDF